MGAGYLNEHLRAIDKAAGADSAEAELRGQRRQREIGLREVAAWAISLSRVLARSDRLLSVGPGGAALQRPRPSPDDFCAARVYLMVTVLLLPVLAAEYSAVAAVLAEKRYLPLELIFSVSEYLVKLPLSALVAL